MKTHLLEALLAAKANDANACTASDVKRVLSQTPGLGSFDVSKITCAKCKSWYWHHDGLVVAPHVIEELKGLTVAI